MRLAHIYISYYLQRHCALSGSRIVSLAQTHRALWLTHALNRASRQAGTASLTGDFERRSDRIASSRLGLRALDEGVSRARSVAGSARGVSWLILRSLHRRLASASWVSRGDMTRVMRPGVDERRR